ncbi:MAG TPA: hypothetical protein VKZ94_00970 [Advenella sp.]|nr:hypothetical protein [Advenella sp.]
MPSVPFRFAPALLSASLLVMLAGCSSPSQPLAASQAGASDTAAREREARPMPAYNGGGQIQIPFGTSEPTQAELLAQRQQQSTTQGLIPEGRTYLGSIPCETSQCTVQRVTLTLLPDGRWRRLSQPLAPAGPTRTDAGCWRPEPGAQPLIHLLPAGGGKVSVATLRMQTPAVLGVQALGAKAVTQRYTLNIQADTESTSALQNDTSFFCPAR